MAGRSPRIDTKVAVIGGGIMGCSTAYYLALAGVEVTLLEKSAKVGLEASGVNAGQVRQQGGPGLKRSPQELPLALAALKLWRRLEKELDYDLEYREVGYLRLVTTEEEFEDLAGIVSQFSELGLDDMHMIREKEVRQIVPQISPPVVGASYCPSDGQVSPLRACFAFARAASRSGATILVNTEVSNIEFLGPHSFRLSTSQGEVFASHVVNCAGVWAGRLSHMVGVNLPVEPKYWECMVTEPLPRFLGPVVTWPKGANGEAPWRNLNVKQMNHGQLLLSGGWTGRGDIASRRREVMYECITGHAHDLLHLFPHLEEIRLIRAWVGVDGHVPDEMLCMGPVREVPGFLFGGPGSGHCFVLGPIVGKLLAEQIGTGKTSIPIDAFSVDRFAA